MELALLAIGAYLGVGVVFAIPFVAVGVGRVDSVAEHAGFGFRLMILPGVAALWPFVLRRWKAASGGIG